MDEVCDEMDDDCNVNLEPWVMSESKEEVPMQTEEDYLKEQEEVE